MASSDTELEQQLLEAGNKLLTPPPSVDELLSLLDQIENYLAKVEQSPTKSMQNALAPSLKALAADQLFRHSDADVKVAVACCISEITRITAPDAPCDDDQMKDIFQLIVSSFKNLSDKSSRSYSKRTSILETVAKVRSCVVMLDLECDALIIEMFQHFLSAIRDYHPESVFTSMETIMTLVLEESEDISAELLSPLLAPLKKDNEEVLPIARKLGEKVLETCSSKVKPYLQHAVKSLGTSLDDYSDVVASICQELSGSVEQNVASTAGENKVEETKPVEASTDEAAEDGKEIATQSGSPKVAELSNDKSAKSVVSNGVVQTCEDESLADSCSLKNKDDNIHADPSKNAHISTDAGPYNLDAEKICNDERKLEEAGKKERKVTPSTISTEPSESSNIDTEKDVQKPLDNKAASKDAPSSPHEEAAVEDNASSENKKVAGIRQPSSPKALEGESVSVVSPSESENLPKAARSKKRLIRDSEPSSDDFSRKTSERASDSDAKLKKRTKKESSSKDSERSADDVSRKTSEGISDSEPKLNKQSSRKTPGKISNDERIPKRDASKKESSATSESETKSMKKPSKKVDVSSNNCDGSFLTPFENKKQRSRGKLVSEKNVSKDSSKDDDKVSSPKSAAKSTKNAQQLETPKTDSKRKRSSGNEKGSETQDSDADDLVGKRVKVYWPKDKEYYKGTIGSYNPSNKKHQVLYDDGDTEILNLKRQKWEFIEDDAAQDEVGADEPESADTAPETPLKKKSKTSADESAKHAKVESVKGGVSASKSKSASANSARNSKESGKTDSKSINDAKAVKKAEDENVGKMKDHTSKGGSKSADVASKSSSKLKNEDVSTSKSSKPKDDGTKTPKSSKQETIKTGKAKQDNPNVASNAKSKSSKSGGKSSINNGAGKLKSGSSAKVKEIVDVDSTDSDDEPLETTKVKSKSKSERSSKDQGSEVKSGKKRRRV